jgi:uncharacterized protein YkwD
MGDITDGCLRASAIGWSVAHAVGLIFALTTGATAQVDAQPMLEMHNAARAAHCTPPLAWSAELAAQAARYAGRCVFEHDRSSGAGENLAWGTGLSAQKAFGLWYGEANLHDFAAPRFGPAGHFTQLLWRDSKVLGCGGAICGRDVFWVCRYSPPGNVEGKYRQNVLPRCR